jgi:ABC-type sugar transport system permease subunit
VPAPSLTQLDERAPLAPPGGPGLAGRRRRAGRRDERSDAAFAYRMLAPALIAVGAVLLFPLGYSLWTSLTEVSPADLRMRFIGLRNYQDMLRDPFFTASLVHTLYFAALTIVGTVVLGLAIALVLNERFPGRRALRAILIVPWAISQVVVGVTWSWILNGDSGIFNAGLRELGLLDGPRGWLSDPHLAMLFVAVAFVWSSVPFAVLLYLTALQAIPADLYKAARVDGANAVRTFRYVTLPALRYTTLLVLVVSSLEGLLAFSLIFVMTGGGPGSSTTVLAWWGYQATFVSLDLGKGAAIFYFLVALMLVVTGVYLRLFQRPSDRGDR